MKQRSDISGDKMAEFMSVLLPIQARLMRKYGYYRVNSWRQDWLTRRSYIDSSEPGSSDVI